MISESGRSKRVARPSSSLSADAKCRALKRPVFGSTRASSSSAGTASERWMSSIGAMPIGISHGFVSQKLTSAKPRRPTTISFERLWNESSPVSRRRIPRASRSISATIEWFSAT
jgi:hypothetical protein